MSDIDRRRFGAILAALGISATKLGWGRSRFAMGLLMTSPGIPLVFMGQEFLEDKQWSDTPNSNFEIWWQGLDSGDQAQDTVVIDRRGDACL